VALVAIGLLRTDASQGHLLGVLRDGERRAALHAAEALAIFKHDPRVKDQVLAAARARRDAGLLGDVEKVMG
jgi:hypothetical protein